MPKFWPVKFCEAAVLPLGSMTSTCTIPLASECAVHVTLAVTVVLAPWATGLGEAVAEEVNTGGAIGVAVIETELGLVPAELEAVSI